MNNTCISIIVPVYNAEQYLPSCIQSILSQTRTDFELILVDDGSLDRSGEICDQFANKDSRIKVIHQSNGGVSRARNAGIEAAQGTWVCFIDADDFILPTYLEEFRFNDFSSCDYILQSSVALKDGHLNEIRRYKEVVYKSGIDQLPHIVLRDGVPWGKAFKRRIIEQNQLRFNPLLNRGEDTLFCLDFLYHATTTVTLPSCGYHYRIDNGDSLTKKDIDPFMMCIYTSEYSLRIKRLLNRSEPNFPHRDDHTINVFRHSLENALRSGYKLNQFSSMVRIVRKWLRASSKPKLLSLKNKFFSLAVSSLPVCICYLCYYCAICWPRLSGRKDNPRPTYPQLGECVSSNKTTHNPS